MVSILQVYVPFKLNFIQHILFMPITTKAINFFFYLCFCFYRIPLVHPLANRGNTAAFSSYALCRDADTWTLTLCACDAAVCQRDLSEQNTHTGA